MRHCAVINEGITTFLEFKEKRKEKVGGCSKRCLCRRRDGLKQPGWERGAKRRKKSAASTGSWVPRGFKVQIELWTKRSGSFAISAIRFER